MDEDKRWIFAREQTEGTPVAGNYEHLLASLMGTDEVTLLPDGSYQHTFTPQLNFEDLQLTMRRIGTELQGWLDDAAPFMQAAVTEMYAALFPERYHRLMLRAARQRARRSVQVRRHAKH